MSNKIIKDCIYGHIEVPKLCQQFMDVPEFQRLRRIKQLGNVSRVYPSATHTRFEHSIGVMYLAGKMCDVLGIEGRSRELIQLAGLYHDIGHLPYSHLFDKVLDLAKPEGIKYDHEERSIDTFRVVSDRLRLLGENEVRFVMACIAGTELPDMPAYYTQVVHGDIDVDRLDYLCRDSYHTGMPSFQATYIILNARIKNDRIAFKRNAYEDIKSMYELRARMHSLVYQHPVSLMYDNIYAKMIMKLIENGRLRYDMLCDYKLDVMLMEGADTAGMYADMENRRHTLYSPDLIEKHVPECAEIDEIEWV